MPRTNDTVASAFDRWPVSSASGTHVDRVKCRYCGWTRAMNASRQRAHLETCEPYLAQRATTGAGSGPLGGGSPSSTTSVGPKGPNKTNASPDTIHRLHLAAALSIYMSGKPFNHWENRYARQYHNLISGYNNYVPPGREAVGSTLLGEIYAGVRAEVQQALTSVRWLNIVFEQGNDGHGGGAVVVTVVAGDRIFYHSTSQMPHGDVEHGYGWAASVISNIIGGDDQWWRVNSIVTDDTMHWAEVRRLFEIHPISAHIFAVARGQLIEDGSRLRMAAQLLDPRAVLSNHAPSQDEFAIVAGWVEFYITEGADRVHRQLINFLHQDGDFSPENHLWNDPQFVQHPLRFWEQMFLNMWGAPLSEIAARIFNTPGVSREQAFSPSQSAWHAEGRNLSPDKTDVLRYICVNRLVLDKDLPGESN